MFAQTTAALTIVALMAGGLVAGDNSAPFREGDRIFLRLTGNLATEYARRVGLQQHSKAAHGLEIEVIASVAQRFDDGRYRIEHFGHSKPINRSDNKIRLVTLEAFVDAKQIKASTTARAPVPTAAPSENVASRIDVRELRVILSDLKHLKLRTWSLMEEIGN